MEVLGWVMQRHGIGLTRNRNDLIGFAVERFSYDSREEDCGGKGTTASSGIATAWQRKETNCDGMAKLRADACSDGKVRRVRAKAYWQYALKTKNRKGITHNENNFRKGKIY